MWCNNGEGYRKGGESCIGRNDVRPRCFVFLTDMSHLERQLIKLFRSFIETFLITKLS